MSLTFLLWLAFLHAVACIPDVAGVLAFAGVPAVAGVSAVAEFIGHFYHVSEGMTVKYLVRHRHRYRQSFLLVRHPHSVISLSPISPITEHSAIAQL